MTSVSGIAHVSLTIRDLRISESWYRRVLGFNKVLEDHTTQFDEVVLLHPDSGVMIGLRQHHIGVTARFDESRTGLDHIALAVPDAVALVDWRKRLQELGVVCSDLVQHRTGTVLVLRDPDHIQVELHCAAPATVWAEPSPGAGAQAEPSPGTGEPGAQAVSPGAGTDTRPGRHAAGEPPEQAADRAATPAPSATSATSTTSAKPANGADGDATSTDHAALRVRQPAR